VTAVTTLDGAQERLECTTKIKEAKGDQVHIRTQRLLRPLLFSVVPSPCLFAGGAWGKIGLAAETLSGH
jgi:hypothetical protein